MKIIANAKLGDVVTFSLFTNPSLPSTYTNVKLKSLLDSDDVKDSIDIQALHANLAGTVPNLPATPEEYLYLKVQHPNGKFDYIGLPWIDDQSLSIVNSATVLATITNVSASELNDIRAALESNGFGNVELKVV